MVDDVYCSVLECVLLLLILVSVQQCPMISFMFLLQYLHTALGMMANGI